jgi:hypothetical protein
MIMWFLLLVLFIIWFIFIDWWVLRNFDSLACDSSLPIAASASLRLLYSLLYSEHIKHIQVLDFLPLYSYKTMIVKKTENWLLIIFIWNQTVNVCGPGDTLNRKGARHMWIPYEFSK